MPPQQTVSRRFSFEQVTIWALLATLILAAIIFIPLAMVPFLPTKTFILAAGAIITLALYILARLTRGNVILPPSLLLGALWLPAIAYGLSALFSGEGFSLATFGGAFETDTLGFILVATVLGTLAALVLRRGEHYRSFFAWLGYALGFVVVVQVLILLVGQVWPNTISPALSIVGSYEDMAVLIGLGVVIALVAQRMISLSSQSRLFVIIGGALGLFLLAVANSSTIWIMVALVSLGLFVEAVMRRAPGTYDADFDGVAVVAEQGGGQGSVERPLALPLIVLAISLFFLIGGTLGNALANGLHVNMVNVRPSFQSTLGVVGKVYHSSPIFGSGPGTFGNEWVLGRDASLNSTVFWNLDFTSGIGFIPTSFATTGIVGLLAWILFMATFLFFGVRAILLRAPQDSFVQFAGVASFVGAVYLFADMIFSVPGAFLVALAFVCAGVFVSLLRFYGGKGQWGVIFGKSPRTGFAIVFGLTLLLLASIVVAYTLIERYVAQIDLARASVAANAGNLDVADALVQQSILFAPTPSAYLGEAAIAGARMNQIANDTTLSSTQAQQQFQTALAAGINAALTATRLSPNDYQSWLALGNLYAAVVPLKVAGAYDNAKAAYSKAEALNPTSPMILYTLAQLEVGNKNNKGAEDDLRAAIALKQDYTAAIFLLSQLEVADGNLKDALASAEAAAYFTPTDPNILFQVGILRAASGDNDGAIAALSAAVSANGSFANARYFLAAVYAKKADYADALIQMQAIAALSTDNAKAVASAITALQAGKDPFPANLLSSSVTPPVSQ